MPRRVAFENMDADAVVEHIRSNIVKYIAENDLPFASVHFPKLFPFDFVTHALKSL
jgi:hypothetical protein